MFYIDTKSYYKAVLLDKISCELRVQFDRQSSRTVLAVNMTDDILLKIKEFSMVQIMYICHLSIYI